MKVISTCNIKLQVFHNRKLLKKELGFFYINIHHEMKYCLWLNKF